MGIGNLMSSHSLSAGHVPLGLGRDSTIGPTSSLSSSFSQIIISQHHTSINTLNELLGIIRIELFI